MSHSIGTYLQQFRSDIRPATLAFVSLAFNFGDATNCYLALTFGLPLNFGIENLALHFHIFLLQGFVLVMEYPKLFLPCDMLALDSLDLLFGLDKLQLQVLDLLFGLDKLQLQGLMLALLALTLIFTLLLQFGLMLALLALTLIFTLLLLFFLALTIRFVVSNEWIPNKVVRPAKHVMIQCFERFCYLLENGYVDIWILVRVILESQFLVLLLDVLCRSAERYFKYCIVISVLVIPKIHGLCLLCSCVVPWPDIWVL